MNFDELNIILEDNDSYLIHSLHNTHFIELSINNNKYHAFPIKHVKSSYISELDIEIKNDNDEQIGFLCLVKGMFKSIESLTIPQQIVFLYDSLLTDFEKENYEFKTNYVVIDEAHFNSYLTEYKKSSMLWGGYSHEELEDELYTKSPEVILAKKNIIIPTEFNKKSLIKATASNFHSERYLKFYHQLEMLFNYLHVCKLKKAGDDWTIFNKIVTNYNREDIKNINVLLKEYIIDVSGLTRIMNNSSPYLDIMDDIFFNYGKDTNPLKDESRWIKFKDLLDNQNINMESLITSKLIKSSQDYIPMILKITAYWIYRVRSSIAHNKIGEFILEESQQEFLVEIGEDLLLEVIQQVFSSEKFKEDIE